MQPDPEGLVRERFQPFFGCGWLWEYTDQYGEQVEIAVHETLAAPIRSAIADQL
jgi:hypothetical protein